LLLTNVIFTSDILADQVLVKIGGGEVTESQLEKAMLAAPFATQFPSMNEKDQAYLRGDMLTRLVQFETLFQEAKRFNLDKDRSYIEEVNNFRRGLLAQRYLNTLHDKTQAPDSFNKKLKDIQDPNALSAARSVYTAKQFKQLKKDTFSELKDKYQVKLSLDKLTADAVLAKGNDFTIKYSDLIPSDNQLKPSIEEISKKVNGRLETILFAREAESLGIEVNDQVDDYSHHLLTQLFLENLQKQWIPNEKILVDYFQRNPNLGYVPERRQIGQIVVAENGLAEQLRKRILAGESLFELAAEYSIDPYGKLHAGDMGWLKENSATPDIEKALKNLPNGKVSDIINTSKGFHLVMVVDRKPSERKSFAAVKDRVKRALIDEKMSPYMKLLTAKHPAQWQIDDTMLPENL
jgi:peptidyl-prolyl cis-trans isomerase C